jgi:hypothetical protein
MRRPNLLVPHSIQRVHTHRDSQRQPTQSLNKLRRDLRAVRDQRELKTDRREVFENLRHITPHQRLAPLHQHEPHTLTIETGKDRPDFFPGHLVPTDIERQIAVPASRIAS